MAYFYRVFATNVKKIGGEEFEKFLEENEIGLTVVGVVDEEDEENLDAEPTALIFFDEKDREVATLEYDELDESDMLKEELEEFQEIVAEMKPEINRAWVSEQLKKTRACYAFNVAKAGFELDNWDKLAAVAEWLRTQTDGFEQSDSGLMTNEEGAVVLEVPDDFDFELEGDDSDENEGEQLSQEAENESDDSNDDAWGSFVAAIRTQNGWITKEITSEEGRQDFLNGSLEN